MGVGGVVMLQMNHAKKGSEHKMVFESPIYSVMCTGQ